MVCVISGGQEREFLISGGQKYGLCYFWWPWIWFCVFLGNWNGFVLCMVAGNLIFTEIWNQLMSNCVNLHKSAINEPSRHFVSIYVNLQYIRHFTTIYIILKLIYVNNFHKIILLYYYYYFIYWLIHVPGYWEYKNFRAPETYPGEIIAPRNSQNHISGRQK